jgi:hypothetical protein
MGEISMIKRGLTKRLAEVGKIKIGGKGAEKQKASGKGTYQLPVRYNHFVITTTERGADGNFIPDLKLMKLFNPESDWRDGQKSPEPKEIKIALLFDDIDMNFRTSFAFYQGATCICRGDGLEADMLFKKSGTPTQFKLIDDGPKTVTAGELRKIVCDPDKCPMMQPDDKGQTKCKPSGILSCIIPDSMNLGGVYRFRTHSWNTVSNILSALEFIKNLTGGILMGLPMKLQFLKKATQEHGNVNVVNIVFDGETHQQLRQAALIEHKNRTEYNINMKVVEESARESGIMEDADDPADVEQEFYPDIDEGTEPKTIDDRAEAALGVDEEEPAQTSEPEAEKPEPEAGQKKEEQPDLEIF